jgi:hypothetical protein
MRVKLCSRDWSGPVVGVKVSTERPSRVRTSVHWLARLYLVREPKAYESFWLEEVGMAVREAEYEWDVGVESAVESLEVECISLCN